MMTAFLLVILLALMAADLSLTALVFVRLYANAAEERLERKVGEHIARDRMDEGFENIMSFSVNGKTGFESEE